MCGIAGIVQLQGASDAARDAPRVAAMSRTIAHRGPDDDGSFFGDGVALGFRRLAIIDLSAAGHQPMASADGSLVLVFNGEIYNHVELAAELRGQGAVFRSRCDAEVVLHAWQRWGEGCLDRFNGMWAFALWDTQRRRLFAARDRFGVKPFVYTVRDGEFFFASEIAALRAVLPLHEANLYKLHDFLAYGYRTNDGQTFFAGVHELPAGHKLVCDEGRCTVSRWWTLPDAPCTLPAAERPAALRELLADAVRLRLRSDVPLALLQSGGLDSSAICALVERALARGDPPLEPVTAFTAVHPGEPEDEGARVALLMQRMPHVHSVLLNPGETDLAEALPRFVHAIGEPTFSATAYAHWLLMRSVQAQGIKVVLNGQGADEGLAGYGRYITGYRLLDLLLAAPWQLPQEMAGIARRIGQGPLAQLAQLAKAMLGRRAASRWRGWVSEGSSRLLAPEFRRAHGGHLPELPMHWRAQNLQQHLRGQLLHYGFNQILHYEDLSSMSCGIEIRSPFVDWRLMSLAMSLRDDERFHRGITKRVLREAFAPLLPPQIVDEHRKIGFATPFARWASTPAFRSFIEQLVAAPEFRARRLWQGAELARALRGERTMPAGFPAWRFIVTELWLRQCRISNA